MKNSLLLLCFLLMTQLNIAQDRIETGTGYFDLHCVGHGSLYIDYKDLIIHIDPFSKLDDYSRLPKADYILITHQHGDHLDPKAIDQIINDNTIIIAPEVCREVLMPYSNVKYISNGEAMQLDWGRLEAVPAYNLVHMRSENMPYHPKGQGNGYVLTIDDKKVYVAGDTENVPEMKKLKNIDIAFLPMNLPYTMTPEMVNDAARMFNPVILYPYHFGETDTQRIVDLLSDSKIEVRLRDMK